MQTFLPFDDFELCAMVLDYRRLGKQRVECKQIYRAAKGLSKGWRNHPVTLMWKDHLPCLIQYAIKICKEWRCRGYKDSLLPYFQSLPEYKEQVVRPPQLFDFSFYTEHRKRLLIKDFEYYSKYFVKESENVKKERNGKPELSQE